MAEGEVCRNIFLVCLWISGCHPLFLRQLFQIAFHVVPILGIPAFRAGAQAEIVTAIQMPFPDIGSADTIVGQALPYGFYIGAQRDAVRKAAVGMGIDTGKQRGARRAADGLAGVGIVIADASLRQGVKVWCVYPGISVAAYHILSGGIGHK